MNHRYSKQQNAFNCKTIQWLNRVAQLVGQEQAAILHADWKRVQIEGAIVKNEEEFEYYRNKSDKDSIADLKAVVG